MRATDAYSGVAGIDISAIDASGRRIALASSTTGNFDDTVPLGGLVDGSYTIEVRARDRVGAPADQHTATESFPVTLDRVGSVYTAAQYDGGPSAAGERLGFEQFELGGAGARHDEDGLREATRVVACRTSTDRSCVERRTRTELDDGGEHLSIRRTPATAEATGGDASSAIVTRRDVRAQAQDGGPIETALAKWQMPPPGHGTRHLVFEESERGYVDEEEVTITRRVLLDAATGLPLRDTRQLGDTTERDIWWSYGRSRATMEEIPADAFAPARSDGAAADEDTEDLSAAPAPAPAPATSAEDRLASAVTFRRAFSLNTDRTFVQALLDDATLVKSRNLYGTPLAGSELTELLERERLVDERAIVNRFGRERSNTFAGAWIDHAKGGVLRVGFTSEAVDRVAALKQLHPLPDRLVAFTAERTLAELDALQKRVETDFDGLAALGVHAVADDVTSNAVEVSVTNKTAEVESELKSRYGSGVRIVEAPMANAERSEIRATRVVPPLLAGLGIVNENCSSAFTVRASNRRFRYLTAGHCTRSVGENVTHVNDLPGERPRQLYSIGGSALGSTGVRSTPRRSPFAPTRSRPFFTSPRAPSATPSVASAPRPVRTRATTRTSVRSRVPFSAWSVPTRTSSGATSSRAKAPRSSTGTTSSSPTSARRATTAPTVKSEGETAAAPGSARTRRGASTQAAPATATPVTTRAWTG